MPKLISLLLATPLLALLFSTVDVHQNNKKVREIIAQHVERSTPGGDASKARDFPPEG